MPKKNKKTYLCNNCGNDFPVWSGQCSACGEWNSLIEMDLPTGTNLGRLNSGERVKPQRLDEIKIEKNSRMSTGIREFDRVLGGGIVPASIILIGGEPGIGKSTILLQTSNNIKKCFYLSAEESVGQIKDRADRLGVTAKEIEIISTGDLESVESSIIQSKPDLVIIDSIQTVYLNSIPGTAGSLVQVRECGIFLQRLAKSSGIPVIIVGHVTKEGNLAGPRMLEHLVDVVLYFEGDRFHDARILRGIKNRYGATNEVGIFSIQEKGLVEINNPSEVFLAERENNPGSIVTSSLEGTRPILVEVQALVVPTNFGYPKRTSSGFDLNRLNILAAVISKTTKINLNNADIYLNVVGGMKLKEPASDLAVCAAVVSSYANKPLDNSLCVYGEVGLSGEIRRVTREAEREKEASNLGYRVLPKSKNLTEFMTKLSIPLVPQPSYSASRWPKKQE